MNPRNKTAVCILHEYLQRGMSKPPKYVSSVEDSSSTPYGCTVVINDIAYGKGENAPFVGFKRKLSSESLYWNLQISCSRPVGIGSSKKLAKNDAAKATLHLLIPELKEKLKFGDEGVSEEAAKAAEEREKQSSKNGLSFFDDIRVEDHRVADLCNKASEPSPYAVLVTCLQK